jgi:hypothetical protein
MQIRISMKTLRPLVLPTMQCSTASQEPMKVYAIANETNPCQIALVVYAIANKTNPCQLALVLLYQVALNRTCG